MTTVEHDTDKNDISFIRFGNTGATGSESWMKGSKMKPYQIKKLKELLAEQEVTPVKSKVEENLQNMLE
jgi:hypothetical protein